VCDEFVTDESAIEKDILEFTVCFRKLGPAEQGEYLHLFFVARGVDEVLGYFR